MDDPSTSSGLIVVSFSGRDGAERALQAHWHARDRHRLSLQAGCVVECDRDGSLTYRAVRDVTPRNPECYGGVLGFALACLLLLPLAFDEDAIEAVPFEPAPGAGCREGLKGVLSPGASAIVFVATGGPLRHAMREAARLGGRVTYVEVTPSRLEHLRCEIERQWVSLPRRATRPARVAG